jgi:hypothetical protein
MVPVRVNGSGYVKSTAEPTFHANVQAFADRKLDGYRPLQPTLADLCAVGAHPDGLALAEPAAIIRKVDDERRLALGQRVLCRERPALEREIVVDEGRLAALLRRAPGV